MGRSTIQLYVRGLSPKTPSNSAQKAALYDRYLQGEAADKLAFEAGVELHRLHCWFYRERKRRGDTTDTRVHRTRSARRAAEVS